MFKYIVYVIFVLLWSKVIILSRNETVNDNLSKVDEMICHYTYVGIQGVKYKVVCVERL